MPLNSFIDLLPCLSIGRICLHLTEGFALALVAEGVSTFLGPTLVGFLFDGYHSYLPGYSALAGLGLAATLLLPVTSLPRFQLNTPGKISENTESQNSNI